MDIRVYRFIEWFENSGKLIELLRAEFNFTIDEASEQVKIWRRLKNEKNS